MNTAIPKPDKFDSTMNIDIYFKQFELFLKMAKVDETDKANMLLSYLDYSVFEAVSSSISISTATYIEILKILLERFSTSDKYVDRISFFI